MVSSVPLVLVEGLVLADAVAGVAVASSLDAEPVVLPSTATVSELQASRSTRGRGTRLMASGMPWSRQRPVSPVTDELTSVGRSLDERGAAGRLGPEGFSS